MPNVDIIEYTIICRMCKSEVIHGTLTVSLINHTIA